MALIKCPECGNLVSDTATCCPRCGAAVSKTKNKRGTAGKEYAITAIVNIALFFLGLVLCLTAREEVFGHSAFFWKSGLWRRDKDTVTAVVQLAVGVIFMISGTVSLLIAAAKVKNNQ